MKEIVADYDSHFVGQREVVDWDRPDGKTYRNVPIVYLRQVSEDDYFEQQPHLRGTFDTTPYQFWEVSVD